MGVRDDRNRGFTAWCRDLAPGRLGRRETVLRRTDRPEWDGGREISEARAEAC